MRAIDGDSLSVIYSGKKKKKPSYFRKLPARSCCPLSFNKTASRSSDCNSCRSKTLPAPLLSTGWLDTAFLKKPCDAERVTVPLLPVSPLFELDASGQDLAPLHSRALRHLCTCSALWLLRISGALHRTYRMLGKTRAAERSHLQ